MFLMLQLGIDLIEICSFECNVCTKVKFGNFISDQGIGQGQDPDRGNIFLW